MKHSRNNNVILGGGITGLSAGYVSKLPIYEANDIAGGICTSYYMRKGEKKRLSEPPKDAESYHFEIGGGHWIFGGDPSIIQFIQNHSPFKRYSRKASIYLPEKNIFIPYPIQNNLYYLDKKSSAKVVDEIINVKVTEYKILTMSKWLKINFGQTLCNIFFHPFHKLYTANLYHKIAPQDPHKSPINMKEIMNGLRGKANPAGYNTTFIYPEHGLDSLMRSLEKECNINYGKKVVKIDIKKKIIKFSDSTTIGYNKIISTLPLNKMIQMTGIKIGEEPHPSPAVLVINIGAKKGPKCPDDQWVYIPNSNTKFHRVGFYSNIDTSFLPKSNRKKNDRTSIYVEKAYPENSKPNKKEIEEICQKTIKELQEWGWIDEVDVYDPTWIETAYTWSWPNSSWKEKALKELEKNGIYQIGRYGRWIFQGIADSIKDGLMVGGAFT
ncbi:MAG: protoporphyrinogen oxidase-like protein [Candidatus Paceibacterota bacterium]|jgi:protoporphyrinogen oxidase